MLKKKWSLQNFARQFWHFTSMTAVTVTATSRSMDEFIAELNMEVETSNRLKPPVPYAELNWAGFAIRSSCSARVLTYVKRLVSRLTPKSLRQQAYMIHEVLAEDDEIKLGSEWVSLGTLFGTSADNVRSLCRNYKERSPFAKLGRPKALDDTQVLQLIEYVGQKACEKNPLTIREVAIYVRQQWGKDISKRTVRRLVKARDELTTGFALPMERARAEVTRAELEEFYRQLKENLEGVLPESVVNLDEVGFSRRCRGTPLKCVIPARLQGSKIEYIPENGLDSTYTILAAVTLAGESLMPYVVAPVKSLPTNFLTDVTWAERDCTLDFSSSGFANANVVSQWYTKVFSEWLRNHRFKIGSTKAPVVLICDGFSGHASDELKAMMARDNVRLVYLPPHSSHLTQALDQYVFATMKKTYSNVKGDDDIADRNGRKINRILKAFYGTCISPMTIRASWKAVGIVGLHDADGRSIGIQVDGQDIITRHVDIRTPGGYSRKRQTIRQDYLGNRQALELVRQGRCPSCGCMNQQQNGQPQHPGFPLPGTPSQPVARTVATPAAPIRRFTPFGPWQSPSGGSQP